jgi:DNA-directed DNA polymerase III PolC
MDNFVHLEVRSAFSFLWGTFNPKELVQEVRNLDQKAVALTDDGLYGAVQFYKAAVNEGIQPIIGTKISIWDGSPIILLATNFQAYGNLCRLLSIALEGGTPQKNFITKQDLSHWNKGLICLAGGRGSRIHSLLEKERNEIAQHALMDLMGVWGDPDRFFLVLQNHSQSKEEEREAHRVMAAAKGLASLLKLPVVATNEVTFLRCEDYHIHSALVGIQKHHHHRSVHRLPNDRFYLASGQEMMRRIPYPEALANTVHIAALCRSFALPIGSLHPPSFRQPVEAFQKTRALSYRELARYHKPVSLPYLRQLEHELAVIAKLKLADFFLMVRDVVDFARSKGIRHSVRGSAAGSLLVYLLLGGVDPLEHNLLFERFINEGRGDLPDIDIDFDSDRRDEIIHHLMELFPKQTAMVCTIQSFKARSAIRLTARALGYSLDEIDHLTTCLPWSLRGSDLAAALENLPELRNSPLHNEAHLVNLATKLVRLPFQNSVHLGGVIIAPENIKDWTPIGTSPKGLPVGHLDKDDVDALGLIKLDLLGLRMHTAIRKALETLWRQGIPLDLERTPLNDQRTYALLRSTDSLGVFQLESPGQRNLLGRLQPTHFGDLIAEISLFRPGPVEGDMVDNFVRRRNNKEPVKIPHPDLEPILGESYGVILYQEQVLKIARVFSGLSYAQADKFRRAMTKDRWSHTMKFLKRQFIQGALAQGHDRQLSEDVFRRVAAFAAFGFCKAHAASFAHITYQSAYLKAHYPQAFYLGLLNAGHVGSYPPHIILNEARRKGIPIYPPHINISGLEYSAEGSGIRVPLVVVNGVGPEMARRIVTERNKRGLFVSREDFLARLKVPDRIVRVLALAGAMEDLDSEWNLTQEVYNA